MRARLVGSFVLVAVAAVAAAVPFLPDDLNSSEDDNDWKIFKMEFNKNYDSEEEEDVRRSIFYENQRKIHDHNVNYFFGLYSYKLKMNQFGDMSFEEYDKYMNGDPNTHSNEQPEEQPVILSPAYVARGIGFINGVSESKLPDSLDWRKYGMVTPVRDQGLVCGSCWAFATTGALEAYFSKKTGKLTTLSVQQLVDCTFVYGNSGCDGGSIVQVYHYASHNHLLSEEEYPYMGKTGKCPYNSSLDEHKKQRASYVLVDFAIEQDMKAALAVMGPLTTAMDASHDTFRFYSEGLYYQPECSFMKLDHAVLVVGYGTDLKNRDYWLMKNSWGPTWGEAGYFKVARNKDNHCGIATQATYPHI